MQKKKLFLLIIFLLSLALPLSGCQKGFTQDEISLKTLIEEDDTDGLMDFLITKAEALTKSNSYEEYKQYAIGDLSSNEAPDLLVFLEKHEDEPSTLKVYSFDGEGYSILDKVSMGLDLANYNMVIGNISENQKGLFMNNRLKDNIGITYGFILENGKLTSILDRSKTLLFSNSMDNSIEDINGDGILEYSISIRDPESQNPEKPDRIDLWYKWDGVLSGNLVKVDRTIYKGHSNPHILKELKNILEHEPEAFLDKAKENIQFISKFDMSDLVFDYINNNDDKAYLYIISLLEENLTEEIMDYMMVLNDYYNHVFIIGEDLAITEEELINRIINIEGFYATYPYSDNLDLLEDILNEYMNIYFIQEMDHNELLHENIEIIT